MNWGKRMLLIGASLLISLAMVSCSTGEVAAYKTLEDSLVASANSNENVLERLGSVLQSLNVTTATYDDNNSSVTISGVGQTGNRSSYITFGYENVDQSFFDGVRNRQGMIYRLADLVQSEDIDTVSCMDLNSIANFTNSINNLADNNFGDWGRQNNAVLSVDNLQIDSTTNSISFNVLTCGKYLQSKVATTPQFGLFMNINGGNLDYGLDFGYGGNMYMDMNGSLQFGISMTPQIKTPTYTNLATDYSVTVSNLTADEMEALQNGDTSVAISAFTKRQNSEDVSIEVDSMTNVNDLADTQIVRDIATLEN